MLLVAVVAVAAAIPAASTGASEAPASSARTQDTKLISRSVTGDIPNGPSTNGVISGDRRWARIIAYQSTASDIVLGDVNRVSDVFAVRRAGHFGNRGTRWQIGKTRLVSRGLHGPANGPSYAPAVDGGFKAKPKCVAFISKASNLVRGDKNRVADAFVSRSGRRPGLVSRLGRNKRTKAATTRVAVSGDCSKIAFVAGGKLFVRIRGRKTIRLNVAGAENDPSFGTGKRNDLVFSGKRGVYLWRGKGRRTRLVARGGRNPAYNEIKRQVVAYEVRRRGRIQIGYKDLGHRQKIISRRGGALGNGNSTDPVIGNSGYYVSFRTAADNLSTDASGAAGDTNRSEDVYLYSDVRNLTLLQSVEERGVPLPGGGIDPSMSFYANYILFTSPAPLGSNQGRRQVFMRWLGSV